MDILVTGGAGYVGSHTIIELVQAGHNPVIYDNFCNSFPGAIDAISKICGVRPKVIKGDILETDKLAEVIKDNGCEAVIHFAGLKSVSDSMSDPLSYFHVNVSGSGSLLEAMKRTSCRKIIFSSSATVYGEPETLPLREDHQLSPENNYGLTKLMVEQMIAALCGSDPSWSAAILRYFNPAGAHPSGQIGEHPLGVPTNLVPVITEVASGKRHSLPVYGTDYETDDGSAVRDYVHVCDLANGHVKALNGVSTRGCHVYNLGTGRGTSVLEMVKKYEEACGHEIPVDLTDRRPGDIACYYCDPDKADRELDWRPKRGLDDICSDEWRWKSNNPNGFDHKT